ncbi:unnamed protein product [Pieris brassicae]|uniref:Uncharacterized protein n=1 Tax=Pieris brassicae TaxID=7116 RepID=A0A9P0X9Z6_PIEBR|nr:unnamed protein product [Pieris brassicae]
MRLTEPAHWCTSRENARAEEQCSDETFARRQYSESNVRTPPLQRMTVTQMERGRIQFRERARDSPARRTRRRGATVES